MCRCRSQQVDVACYLFDGFFVAIEQPREDGSIEALVVPTVGDLTVAIRHKVGALALDRRVRKLDAVRVLAKCCVFLFVDVVVSVV